MPWLRHRGTGLHALGGRPARQNPLPRCYLNGTGTTTSFTVNMTGWLNAGFGVQGAAPQAGDLVVLIATQNSGTAALTLGTGATGWTVQENDHPTSSYSFMIAYRIFDGTEAASATFGTTAGSKLAYSLIAISPVTGQTISIDAWAVTKLDATGATTHTPNSAAAVGAGELSLILNGLRQSTAAATAISLTTPSAGWTAIPGSSNIGTASVAGYLTQFTFQTNESGTVAPGAETFNLSTLAGVAHLLVRQALPATGGGARTGSDSSITSDAATVQGITGARSASDTTLTSDAASRLLQVGRTASDTSATSDVATRTWHAARTASDTSVTTDAATATVQAGTQARSAVDTSATSDAAIRAVALGRTGADTSALTDVATRALRVARTGADTSTTTDAATRALRVSRTTADTTLTSDSAARSALAFARTGADTSIATDAVTRLLHVARTTSDTTTSTDAATRALSLVRATADTSLASDAATRAALSLARTANDGAVTTDVATRLISLGRLGADTSTTTDVSTRLVRVSRTASDTSASSDVGTRMAVFARSAADTTVTHDVVGTGGGISRATSDASTTTDAAVRSALLFTRSASDTSLTTDAVTRTLRVSRAATDTSLSSDSTGAARMFVRSALEGGAANLAKNPSFEYDAIGAAPAWWTKTQNQTINDYAVRNAWSDSGTQALHVSTTMTAANQFFELLGPHSGVTGIPVAGGFRYFVSMRFDVLASAQAGAGADVRIQWYDASGVSVGSTTIGHFYNLGVYTVSGVVTAPASAAYGHVFLVAQSATVGSYEFYLDSVMFVQSGTAVSYFDGDSPDSQWTGTPGSSVSQQVIATADSASVAGISGSAGADVSASTDSAARFNPFARTAGDSTLTSDTTSRGVHFSRSASDTSLVSDVAVRMAGAFRQASDVSISTDSAGRVFHLGRTASDTSRMLGDVASWRTARASPDVDLPTTFAVKSLQTNLTLGKGAQFATLKPGETFAIAKGAIRPLFIDDAIVTFVISAGAGTLSINRVGAKLNIEG